MENEPNTTSMSRDGTSQTAASESSTGSRSNTSTDFLKLDVSEFRQTTWSIRNSHCTYGLVGKKLRCLITFVCVVAFSLFGVNQGLMSGIITADQFIDTFPAVGGSSGHSTVVQGAVTSCYELGCFFGALTALWIGEKYGRRPMIITGSSILILGTFITIFPFKGHWALGHFVIGRVITGIGNGFNTATVPIYQSELSKPEIRGRLVNLEGSAVAVGTFIAYWVDFGLSYVSNSASWRFPISLQIIFATVVLIGIIGLPESPRWLIAKGRLNEACYIISQTEDLPPDDDEIIAEISAIRDAVDRFDSSQMSLTQLIKGGKHQYLRRILLGASGQFFQQFTGCNAAIYYSTVLFENTIGMTRRMALILGGVFATVYALFTVPSFFLIDRLGRRPLFCIGAVGQGVSFVIAFACLIPGTVGAAKGAAFGLFLFISFFAFTMLPLPWVYPPEINSLRTRTLGTSVSTCTNWLSNFTVVMFTPIFINETKWGCYLFFALMNFLYVPIIYFFYPETAGRSLEEIDIIFARAYSEGVSPVSISKSMPNLSFEQVEKESERLGLHGEFKAEAAYEENFNEKHLLIKRSTSRAKSKESV
ncbi:hypothetical protein FOA43_003151 [Brettanomyces nanus]|uniref:Major facilitator superfamily (MFS) profile domain-containing protein n=1 Tax=Eeniella nana TaxID=13502 RepID=A0A875RQ26_EENNA|nr:uncharacterized protein FOA43_003151 [Brettanomyces nanus]QPG75790.1 hypothetical protein FOA43_003151 [Brettanomyces nanus]